MLTSTPVGGAGDQDRVGAVREQLKCRGQIGGTHELGIAGADPRRTRGGRRLVAALGQGVVGPGLPEREGGVLDRAVARAPAQVAAQRVQVEAVRPVLLVGLGAGRVGVGEAVAAAHLGRARCAVRPAAAGPVVLRGHAAHESRGAVAALGATTHRNLVLDRVQGTRGAESFGGQHLLAVEAGRGDQTGVDGYPLGAPVTGRGGASDHDGAGAALALGTAFLAPGQAAAAQPVQGRGVRGDAGEPLGSSVDRHSGCAHPCLHPFATSSFW